MSNKIFVSPLVQGSSLRRETSPARDNAQDLHEGTDHRAITLYGLGDSDKIQLAIIRANAHRGGLQRWSR